MLQTSNYSHYSIRYCQVYLLNSLKMLQNSVSQWRKKLAHPFHFDEVQSGKNPSAKTPCAILVSTKPTANKHLPFSADHAFEPCFLPAKFEKFAESIREFSVRKNDVWILSFPQSGGNFAYNFVQRLKNSTVTSSDAILESDIFTENPPKGIEKTLDFLRINSIEKLDKAPSPRVIQSHLPPNLLPAELWTIQPKMIYITRDAKDVSVATFHALNNANQIYGTIDNYFDNFLANRTWYAPFCAHVNDFSQLKHLTNFLFVNYDDLMTKQFQGIKRICTFLDCSTDDDELEQIADLLVLFSYLLYYCGFSKCFRRVLMGASGFCLKRLRLLYFVGMVFVHIEFCCFGFISF